MIDRTMRARKVYFITLVLMLGLSFLRTGDVGADSSPIVDESVTLPIIADFSLSPVSIDAGSTAILSWEVKNGAQVNIDQGVGNVASSGQVKVAPLYRTTYKLTASNGTGIRTRYLTLSVTPMQTGDLVNSDPVTGRNAELDFRWEQLCLSKQYQVQIARDPVFSLIVYDSVIMEPADVTSPAFFIGPGMLEAGHAYYWRVRTRMAATGQYILSPWSDVKTFSVRPGYPIRTDYYGIAGFTPANGCLSCPVKPVAFSWSGYQGTTKYRFTLARDHELQDIVVEATVPTTSYALGQPLEYETSYFWQVMALEPIPSDPSPVFTFSTESPAKPVQQPTPGSIGTPAWVWAVIAIGIFLIILVVVLAIMARKR
ncbi:MAG: hypothetical protein PHO26_09215 [Dehalococcoidia bacterium]|nr:hypothetical protein [Dehalococcoidia bacterium]MDD5493361.1 hypothetical protein [Dehalococcoidia bacterium]